MATTPTPPRIAWLVNLFGDPGMQHAHAARLLHPLSEQLGAQIVPLYCLDQDADALSDVPEAERPEYTRARLIALLGENDLPIGEAIVIASGADPSTKEKSDALSRAVDDAGVLFTFVHSHAYTGVDRLMLGSFAEHFFMRTRQPVLILNPHSAVPADFTTISFGTDLGEQSTRAFHALLPLARMLKADVRIEHQIVVREMSFFMKGPAAKDQYDDELKERREYAESDMQPLLVAAEAAGVRASAAVEFESPATTPAEGLERRAEASSVSLISVAAHGDKKRPGNIGSTALWLIRNARRPVLVFPAREAH